MNNHADHEPESSRPRSRPTLSLDLNNKKVLGVCSGFARYLEVPVALVRLIYIIACVVSPFLIPGYLLLYWIMARQPAEAPSPKAGWSFDLKRPIYRSRRNARVAGVCAGLAEYLNISTGLLRLATVIALIMTGGTAFWAYVICWIVLDKEPKSLRQSSQASAASGARTARPQDSDLSAQAASVKDCARRLQATEQRLRNAEAYITSRQFRLHCEINRI